MYFIKLIVYIILFEMLTCLGIDSRPGKIATVDLLSDSLEYAVLKTASSYQKDIVQGREIILLVE